MLFGVFLMIMTLAFTGQGSSSDLTVKGTCRAECQYGDDGQLACKRTLGYQLFKVQCCLEANGQIFSFNHKHHRCEKCEHCSGQPLDPICGSNGVTYNNACQLRAAACRMPHIRVEKDYNGTCQETCDSVACDDGYRCAVNERGRPACVKWCEDDSDSPLSAPICGADGVTYAGKCALQRAWIRSGEKYLAEAYEGKCNSNVTCKSLRCWKHKYLIKYSPGAWTTPRMACVADRTTKTPRCMPTMVSNCDRKRNLCGSDGRVYADFCVLLERVDYTKTTIDVVLCPNQDDVKR